MVGAVYLVGWRLSKYQEPLVDDERSLVSDAFRYFDGQRYSLYAFAVMDVVVRPGWKFSLERIIHSWKSFTALKLVRTTGRVAPIWHPEFYDRILRDQKELDLKVAYVLDNPFRRWGDISEYAWAGTGVGEGLRAD